MKIFFTQVVNLFSAKTVHFYSALDTLDISWKDIRNHETLSMAMGLFP